MGVPSLERMLGYHPSDVVGTPFDLNADTEAQSLGAAFKRMVSDRQESARFLLQVRHADGTRRWVEVHAALVLDGGQQPTSAVASVRDITAQIEAERSHDEQDRRLAALDSMLDPHVLLEAVRDEDGRVVDFVFTDANTAACDYNRLPREKLLGSTVLGLLPGHARPGGCSSATSASSRPASRCCSTTTSTPTSCWPTNATSTSEPSKSVTACRSPGAT